MCEPELPLISISCRLWRVCGIASLGWGCRAFACHLGCSRADIAGRWAWSASQCTVSVRVAWEVAYGDAESAAGPEVVAVRLERGDPDALVAEGEPAGQRVLHEAASRPTARAMSAGMTVDPAAAAGDLLQHRDEVPAGRCSAR